MAQAQELFNQKFASVTALVWIFFYGLQLFLSDSQKTDPTPWLIFRFASIAVLLATFFFLRQAVSSKTKVFAVLVCGAYLSSSYAYMSKFGLPMRTSWVVTLGASFLATVVLRGHFAFLLLALQTGVILSTLWVGTINSIWFVSDSLFGGAIIAAGVTFRFLNLKAEERSLVAQEALNQDIQHQLSIYAQVSRFIPKAIHRRIQAATKSGITIETALKKYLKVENRFVTIMYSDLRNYSLRSHDLDFVREGLVRSHESVTTIVEQNEGVPQQAGDSILAYFAYEQEDLCLLRGLNAAILCQLECDKLRKSDPQTDIERYFIVTSGQANVGNVFGDEHFELSVNGKPANLAARLDEISKNQFLKKRILNASAILLDFNTKKRLLRVLPGLNLTEITLSDIGISLRTYTEEKRVFLLPATTDVAAIISSRISEIHNEPMEEKNEHSSRAA